MDAVIHQLRNVKQGKAIDISPEITVQFLDIIMCYEGYFHEKSVVVFNSESGILHIGLGLTDSQTICSFTTDEPSSLSKDNIKEFEVVCDFVTSKQNPFKGEAFEMAVVGPVLDRDRLADTSSIEMACTMARKVYCMYNSEHMDVFNQKFPNSIILDTLLVRMPGSVKLNRPDKYGKYFVIKAK